MIDLNHAFQALADSTRRAILARLSLGEATATELAKPFSLTQPTISQHIKVLSDAGLIVRSIDGTRRPCRLAREGIAAVDQWLGALRDALDANYERLDAVLAEMNVESERKNS